MCIITQSREDLGVIDNPDYELEALAWNNFVCKYNIVITH